MRGEKLTVQSVEKYCREAKGDEDMDHCFYFCSAFKVFECCTGLLGLELPGFIPECQLCHRTVV
jgi:hypothetical protein